VKIKNAKGIYLSESSKNNIINNTANSNTLYGIYLEDYSSNNTLQGNEISNNSVGIYSNGSNSTVNSNIVCGNINLDFSSPDWLSSSGDNNTCDNPGGWNDDEINSCRYTCSGLPRVCDINRDGIIIHDYNDLINSYKCFLGVEMNCTEISFLEWVNIKQEYNCFAGINI